MIRVGLIGEDHYDKVSIKNLLGRTYSNVTFIPVLKGVRGCTLDSPKLARALKTELACNKYDFLIFIRDLDGFDTNTEKKNIYERWFTSLKKYSRDMLLLNIWELETLILGDIDTFNKIYSSSLKQPGNPMIISNPKELLSSGTSKSKRKYSVSDCPEIFDKLLINSVRARCNFFENFLISLEERLLTKN